MTSDHMADHWWWRPGWRLGRRMYTWHFTFAGQQAVHDLAASYQARLAGLPGLDLIRAQWLHLTTQGVGFTDEISDDEVAAVAEGAAGRLKATAPAEVTLGPTVITPEAILLKVSPVAELAAIRDELRSAISGVLGAGRLMESAEWTPHVSVAYSHGTAPSAPYADAVADGPSAGTIIRDVELIVLGRDHRAYEWTSRAVVPLTRDGASEGGPG